MAPGHQQGGERKEEPGPASPRLHNTCEWPHRNPTPLILEGLDGRRNPSAEISTVAQRKQGDIGTDGNSLALGCEGGGEGKRSIKVSLRMHGQGRPSAGVNIAIEYRNEFGSVAPCGVVQDSLFRVVETWIKSGRLRVSFPRLA